MKNANMTPEQLDARRGRRQFLRELGLIGTGAALKMSMNPQSQNGFLRRPDAFRDCRVIAGTAGHDQGAHPARYVAAARLFEGAG